MKKLFSILPFLFLFISFAYPKPKLRFVQQYVGLDTVREEQKEINCEIRCFNIGDSPLYMTEYLTFCPCVTAELPTEALLPGDTTTINIKYTFSHPLEYNHQVRIFYNTEDPEDYDYCAIYGFVIPKEE